MRKIVIRAGAVAIRARLLDTPTAERIWAALPIEAAARTWGEEIYFDAPVTSAAFPAPHLLAGNSNAERQPCNPNLNIYLHGCTVLIWTYS